MHSCSLWQCYTSILILINVVLGKFNCKPDHKHGMCSRRATQTEHDTKGEDVILNIAVPVGDDGFTCKDVDIEGKKSKHGTCCDGDHYVEQDGSFGIVQAIFDLDCHNVY
ncbi:hypothetical protein MJO29_003026 [Puccinia striiformis f. sp. tritici]|uniref:Uncharacterized protein n=2 Tax=Puccinia striiformis TaxID=27350 RepID=A0A0L0VAE3_9BASI|nr:hypothetical protein MJO29_003026 [Puccinia striiformis f. sp. tritici]KNE96257.1 hypothetical protein PSTG_10380 [Puccinia striiformis f. sp. tritici PST-78]POW09889.1 hypothetical protein PSTT_06517 [Puccinia striiformis]